VAQVKARIVAVDDEPLMLRVTTQVLRSAGYQVIEAENGTEGIHQVRRTRPDLVLLDRMLPDLDGVEVCRLIKEDPDLARTFVVFLSAAQVSSDEQATGLEAGADGYIARPISSRELLARVEVLLRIKRAEDARQESERNFLRTFDQAPIGASIVSLDFRYLRVNEKFCEITGYSERELLSLRFTDITHPEDAEADVQQARRLLTGESDRYELDKRYIRKDGQIVWVRLSSCLIRDSAGRPLHFLPMVQDITERLQVEKALRESEERYRRIVDTTTEGTAVTDENFCLTFVNPRLAEMVGYSAEEMLGRRVQDFMFQEDLAALRDEEQARRQGMEGRYERRFRCKDGRTLWTIVSATPLMEGDGRFRGSFAMLTDITEHKQAEDSLHKAHSELKTLFASANILASTLELAPLLTLILDELGKVVAYDSATLLTLDEDDMVIQARRGSPLPVEPGALRIPLAPRPTIRRMILTKQAYYLPDALEVPDIGQFLERITGLAAESNWGGVRGMMGVPLIAKDEVIGMISLGHRQPDYYQPPMRDLVQAFANQAAVAIENAWLYQQAQEAAVVMERNRLARDLHDSVTQALFSASLVAEVLPQVWRRDPQEAQQGLEELRRLTRGALAEMRTMLLELRPTALIETPLRDLIQQLTEAITSRIQIEMALNLAAVPALPPEVHVNFYRITQEALHNVAKHARASHLTVSLTASPPFSSETDGDWRGQIDLLVRDDGRGFDPGHAAADQLGLRIMRERAEGIGATLSVESCPGSGTLVQMVWPNT
jgi:PAS domain S-box-containing protein